MALLLQILPTVPELYVGYDEEGTWSTATAPPATLWAIAQRCKLQDNPYKYSKQEEASSSQNSSTKCASWPKNPHGHTTSRYPNTTCHTFRSDSTLRPAASARQHDATRLVSTLPSVACQHVAAFGLHFKEVVWGRHGKLGTRLPSAPVLCVRKGGAAAYC